MRKFEEYDEQRKIKALLMALAFAATASDADRAKQPNFYEMAASQGKLSELRAEDFELIKNQTVEQLVNKIKV